jgi:hypothetical protein
MKNIAPLTFCTSKTGRIWLSKMSSTKKSLPVKGLCGRCLPLIRVYRLEIQAVMLGIFDPTL